MSIQQKLQYCRTAIESGDNIDQVSDLITDLIEQQHSLERELHDKSKQLQYTRLKNEELQHEEDNLLEYINNEAKLLEQDKHILQQIENDIQMQKQREITLQMQIKQNLEQEQHYEQTKQYFLNIYNQCNDIHTHNQLLATQLMEIQYENQFLQKDCQQLEQEVEQQTKYITCLRELNQKTEETLVKLEHYQCEIKQLIHNAPLQETNKFDPLLYIKSVASAHQEEVTEVVNELDSVTTSFLNEIESHTTTLKERVPQQSHMKYIVGGVIIVGAIGVTLWKKGLFKWLF